MKDTYVFAILSAFLFTLAVVTMLVAPSASFLVGGIVVGGFGAMLVAAGTYL